MAERGRVYNRIFNEEEWKLVNKDNKNLMEDFLLELKQKKKSKGTIDQYKNDLRIIFIYVLRELGNKSMLELNKKHFRNISLWCSETLNHSNARANRILSATRSMLDFAEQDDDYEYEQNYAKKVKGLSKEEVREIYFLTDENIEKLKNELIKREDYIKASLLCLAYESAGRRNELLQVKKEGILEKNQTNTVVGKRNKKFPLVYFNGWFKECVELYLKQRGEDDIEELWIIGKGENKRPATYEALYDWFVSMASLLSELEGKEIPFNAHSLRHSALQNMSKGQHYICRVLGKTEGFSLNELKVYAHHESSDTTNSYLKNDDSNILSNMFGLKLE
jgi:integrase/recombinase XerD